MEWLLILGFALLSSYLGYRLMRLNQGVRQLDECLKSNARPPSVRNLPVISQQEQLESLSHTALDSVAEAALSLESETAHRRFVEALLNEIDDGLIVVNEELEIVFSNRAAEQLFPSDQPHLGRQLIAVCFDHRIVDTVELALAVEGKTQDQISHHVPRKRDQRRTLLIEAEPLDPARGIGSGAWLHVRDVTQQLETEQIRRDFIANASHELRTPLSIISGYLEMFDVDNPELTVSPRHISTMRKHSDRLSRIVEDMLAISKLESSHEMLKQEEFDLADSITDVIDHLHPVIEEHRAKIKLTLSEEREERLIAGDRFYWDQIFFNLIENAIKQNANAGVRVEINQRREKNGRLKIQVSDNGVGIPNADLGHIFKRFYRVEKHHARDQATKGTGLGLSIVKRAVEAHNGQISVASIPGTKTTFTISVPGPPLLKVDSEAANT